MTVSISYATGKNDYDYGWQGHHKPIKEAIGVITFDASYPTGGEPIATTLVHADCVEIIDVKCNETAAYFALWDDTNKKLLMYTQSDNDSDIAEVPNETNLSAVSLRITLKCI